MRVVLVEPRPPGHNVYDFALLPRLGLPLMGRMLAEAGHDVRIYCELLSPVDIEECLAADLVGISSTTATQPAAYRLADLLAASGVRVVLGGPHVSFRQDEALAHAPFVVRGEGQATLLELVDCLEKELPLSQVRGLSFRDEDGESCRNPGRPTTTQEQFAALPAPDLSLIAGYERMATKPIMTQWGCPFDCEFCSVTTMFSRSVRRRSTDQVLAELAGLGADRAFFYDDNFVVNKARTTELLTGMISANLTPSWSAQVRADVVLRSVARPDVDHEFLSLMRRAGASVVMIGFEAITDEGLASVGKRLNVATQRKAVQAFHDHGIAVHGMFIAGLYTDDVTTAPATAVFARRLGIDTFQLMAETPLPGTRLWERVTAEGRLLSEDWSLFDGHQVVMRPARMSPLDLQLGVLEAMRRFYSWPRIMRSGLIGALSHLPDLMGTARPAMIRRLPALARMAWARRWDEVAPLLRSAMPERVRRKATAALWLPALRFYARRQLGAWRAQERSRAHLEFLASLP
ncbi:MAG TPA: radical SAM protein [Acidimicrobiales bacterium]|nr:radical SAM protein [Acidimicrobiales bacterium]